MEKRGSYSVPTSPSRRCAMAYDPLTPRTPYEDANSDFEDEFEFETSFFGEEYEVWEDKGLERRLSFADELFYKGKVMPLQPPPRLQTHSAALERSMSMSSPISARSSATMLKINPFRRNSFWNDDFDPFMEALENVKKEKEESSKRNILKRALSMPHMRASSPSRVDLSEGLKSKEIGMKSPTHLGEPKGVVFARRARLVKMGHEKPPRPSSIAPPLKARESGSTCAREGKTKQIKKIFLGSSPFRKTTNEDKHHDVFSTSTKPTLRRSFSFRARSMELPENKEEKSVIYSRPKLFSCLGYGRKYED